jgi:O-antigen ligase
VSATALGARAPGGLGDRALGGLAVVLAVPAGCAVALVLYRFPPPLALAVGGGVGLVCVLALAVVRYHAAVALAFALLGVVVVDPAPADGVFCVVMAVALTAGSFKLSRVPRAVVAILAVYAALNLMSAVQVADPGRASVFFAITLYLALLALWLPNYVVSTGRARLVVRAYLIAAVASAAIGVLALLAPVPGKELLVESDRARALFQDPNVFGPFLIPAALILAGEIVNPRLLRASALTKGLLIIVLLLGVLFSYSRGAWLNLVVAFAVMAAAIGLRVSARKALTLVAVAVVAGVAVAAAVVATGSADFLAERARPQTYDTERFSGQRAGLQPAQEYPLGAGPGQFESVANISAHSTYARTVGEQGFPGLLVLVALLAVTLGIAVRNAAHGRDTHGIGAPVLLAAWCGLLANSAFIDTLHWRHLWIVAALIWAGAMTGSRSPRPLR